MEVTKKANAQSPLSVMYVEVNSNNFKNVSCYSVNDEPFFDIAIIFAANIYYDVATEKAFLHLNPNVTRVLENPDDFIRPLQARGIKVLLSFIGSDQGRGVCNFPTQASARDFAEHLHELVERYGLDGIDIDDEYINYGANGTGPPNQYSFIYLLREMRELMPEKLITFYFYGPASSRLSWSGIVAGSFIDYSYNAMYGSFSPPVVPGLDRNRIGPAAVWVNHTSAATAQNMATRTVEEGYGVYLCYDLTNGNQNGYLSGIAERLYGVPSTIDTDCLGTWPPQGSKDEKDKEPQLPLRKFNRSE